MLLFFFFFPPNDHLFYVSQDNFKKKKKTSFTSSLAESLLRLTFSHTVKGISLTWFCISLYIKRTVLAMFIAVLDYLLHGMKRCHCLIFLKDRILDIFYHYIINTSSVLACGLCLSSSSVSSSFSYFTISPQRIRS